MLTDDARRLLVAEYGPESVAKVTANFMSIGPEQEVVRIRLPRRSGDPWWPVVERGGDEIIWVGVFSKHKYIPETRLMVYHFRRIEKAHILPEEEIPPLWELFNPPELTHVRKSF